MPPRKRGAAAKKPAARTRASTRTSKNKVVPLNVVEENEVPEQQQEVPVSPVVERESDQVEDVSVAEASVAEEVPPSTDEDKVVVKEEVLVTTTTVVVEESKVIEEIVEEMKSETVVAVEKMGVLEEKKPEEMAVVEEETEVVEEIAEGKKPEEVVEEETTVVEEIVEEKKLEMAVVEVTKDVIEIVEEKSLDTVVVEEKMVVEEIVEEKNMEIASTEAKLDTEMEENAPEEDPEEVEEDPEEVEEDPEEVEEDPEEVLDSENKDETMNEDQVAKQDIDEETVDAEDTIGGKVGQDTTDANEGGDMEGEGESGTDDDEEDEDPSAYMHAPLTDRKKQKEFEIFVGGLDKGAVEDDLTKVFAEFGEIQSVRIVKHPTTQKSKGFAFIRYATVEQAKKALEELKDGTEVRGKRVGISPSQDSDTLYMGNICKTWMKDQVLETLKTLGIEQVEEVYLPDDPKHEGKIRGFALLEFSSHSDAMAAFQRLRKPDAIFGCDRSAKVAFAQSSINPSDEALSQVKTVFVEGLTESWNEEKLREFCKQYGEIEKVQLSRNLVTTKRKDFGFVTFTSRESAVACVEAINSAQIAEGDVKVNANLAKPQYKGRLGKQAARGGYKVKTDGTEEAGPSKMKGQATPQVSEGKGKFSPKLRSIKGGKPFKPQSRVGERQGTGAPFRSDRTDRHRMEQPGRGGRRGGRSMEAGFRGQSSRYPHGNMNGQPSRSFGNQRNNSRFGNTRQNYGAPPLYVDPYAQGYAPSASSYRGHATPSASSYRGHAAPSASSYRGHAAPSASGYLGHAAPSASSYRGHAYGAHSGSKRHYSDMEPHSGFIEPSTAKQGRDRYGYDSRRGAGGYGAQGSAPPAYGGGSVPSSSYAPGPTAYAGYEAAGGAYVYPSGAASYPHPHQPQPQPQQHPHPYPQPQQQPQQIPPRQGYY